MTITVGAGGGSAYPFPTMPTPVSDGGRVFIQGNRIPHKGTLIDNIYIPTAFVNTTNGTIVGRLNSSVIWSVDSADINASCDGFLGVFSYWYDDINDRLYVFGLDVGTTPDTVHTAYITLETGAVTGVGSDQLSVDPTSLNTAGRCAVNRTNIDSGNFTLICQDRTIVINESTGVEVSNVASQNVGAITIVGALATSDGTTTLGTINYTADDKSYITINKGGNGVFISMPIGMGNPVVASNFAIPWGSHVKVFGNATTNGGAIQRTFLKTDMDDWIALLATFGGLT